MNRCFCACDAHHAECPAGPTHLALHRAYRYAPLVRWFISHGEKPSGGRPDSGHWFVFINRRRTQLRVLAFEEGGYCIWAKRLEQGQFAFPAAAGEDKQRLCQTEFLALVEGIDLVIKRQRKRYKMAA